MSVYDVMYLFTAGSQFLQFLVVVLFEHSALHDTLLSLLLITADSPDLLSYGRHSGFHFLLFPIESHVIKLLFDC